MSEAANEAYREAIDDGTAPRGRRAPLGALRLENRRSPFAGPLADITVEQDQIHATFEEELDLAELCALPLGSRGHDSSPIGLQLVDLVDTTTGAVSYVFALHGYGHGAVFRAGTSTLVSWISQHGTDPCKDTGKAWIADFARAWTEGAKRLGLWAGHIIVTDEELGEPDDENDEDDALRRPTGALR